MDDAQRKRTIQHIRQRRAVVPVNLDTQRYLDRFEDSDLGREAILRLQRIRYNPSQALLAAQKKREKKQKKGAKKNLKGELADIKRKQKIFEEGQRRYKEGEDPRLFTGLAGVAAGLGAVAAALPAAVPAAAPPAAVPAAAPAAPVFNFDPEIERQRLAMRLREGHEAHELAQARLAQEAEQLNLNRERLQADDDRENRRLDIEQQRLDDDRRATAEEQRLRAEQAGQALQLEKERFDLEQEAERQRLQDLRQGGGGFQPEPEPQAQRVDIGAPPGVDPALVALQARFAEQESAAERERARAYQDARDARAREAELNASVRELAERASAAQAREEAQAAEIERIRSAPGGGALIPAGSVRSDADFLAQIQREVAGVESGLDRRFEEQSNALTEQIAAHLQRTGRGDDVDLPTELLARLEDALERGGGGLEPQPAPVETREGGTHNYR